MINEVDIPLQEKLLHENEKALESLKQGLKDAAAGRVRDRGTFLQYIDDEEDEVI